MQGVFITGSRDDAWLVKLQTIYRMERRPRALRTRRSGP